MQLHVAFDDQLLLQYHFRGDELFFEIYFENEGKFYPEERHMDFGEVILQWWVRQLIYSCQYQDTPKLLFMDGDYCLEFDKNFESVIGSSSLKELVKLIKAALLTVIDKKTELQLPVKEIEHSLNQLMSDSTF